MVLLLNHHFPMFDVTRPGNHRMWILPASRGELASRSSELARVNSNIHALANSASWDYGRLRAGHLIPHDGSMVLVEKC